MISYFFNTDLDLLFGLLCYLQKRSENYAQIQRRMQNVCLDLKLLRYFEKWWDNWGEMCQMTCCIGLDRMKMLLF